jgi:hypothetical protein
MILSLVGGNGETLVKVIVSAHEDCDHCPSALSLFPAGLAAG